MMALGGVGWQQWWYKWSGEAARDGGGMAARGGEDEYRLVFRRSRGAFLKSPEKSRRKTFPAVEQWWRRWPEVVAGRRWVSGKTEKLSGMSFHIELL
ncbi:hypothetical protein Tco_0787154 [Tanacetum coccineum]